jgi:anti-sigma factor RsiW
MNCPLETPDTADLLLKYCDRTLAPTTVAVLERHMAICPACREFAQNHATLWSALDAWEAPPVSADFDRRLYQRIEAQPVASWRERASSLFRPLFAYRGIPAAAAACLIVTAGLLLDHSGSKPMPAPLSDATAVVDVQPEQVEKALDAMDVLSEFNRKVRTEPSESKL